MALPPSNTSLPTYYSHEMSSSLHPVGHSGLGTEPYRLLSIVPEGAPQHISHAVLIEKSRQTLPSASAEAAVTVSWEAGVNAPGALVD